jgi:hypothetical protein
MAGMPASTFGIGNPHVPMSQSETSGESGLESTTGATGPARWARVRRAGLGQREADSGLFSN